MAGIGGLPEEAKERLVEEGGLDPSDGAGLVLLPKIHAAESRGLDVAAKLEKKKLITDNVFFPAFFL